MADQGYQLPIFALLDHERFLDDEVHHDAFVIDCTLKIQALATDPADHLVEMPTRGGRSFSASEIRCDLRAELDHPATHGFVGDVNPSWNEPH